MAFAAIGPFNHPDTEQDESWPNAYFVITEVNTSRVATPYSGMDSLAHYKVYKSKAAKQDGKKERYSNTFPFDYVPADGNIFAQALEQLKLLPEYPGLVND
jgi:hypothetical protein